MLSNEHLHIVYKKCHVKPFKKEIRAKYKRIISWKRTEKKNREEFQYTLSCLYFSLSFCSFLVTNDKPVLHEDNIQKQKPKRLLKI